MKGRLAGRFPSDTHVLTQMGTVSTSYLYFPQVRAIFISFSNYHNICLSNISVNEGRECKCKFSLCTCVVGFICVATHVYAYMYMYWCECIRRLEDSVWCPMIPILFCEKGCSWCFPILSETHLPVPPKCYLSRSLPWCSGLPGSWGCELRFLWLSGKHFTNSSISQAPQL